MNTPTRTRPRIVSMKIERLDDESPDTSCLGEFTDDLDDDCILFNTGEFIADLRKNEDWEAPRRGRNYLCFRPYAGGEKVGTNKWREYATQDYDRQRGLTNGSWYFLGLRATAEVVIGGVSQKITSGGLWGIESDSGADYLREIGTEQLTELAEVLEEMGFSAKQVSAARLHAAIPA